MAIGYRYGEVGAYTGGDPAEARVAWRALDYEYRELGNEHLLNDVVKFLGVSPSSWAVVIQLFRSKHGETRGIWLTRTKRDASELYGDYGDLEEHEYDKDDIISDLGPDGIFVLLRTLLPASDVGSIGAGEGRVASVAPTGGRRGRRVSKRRSQPVSGGGCIAPRGKQI